jgi:DNA-directed RNA polymerase subunit RPC12/RpoP
MAVCEHCGCKVIGHGVVVQGSFYCCAHCARHVRGDAPVRDSA